jgi:hypothetical protein
LSLDTDSVVKLATSYPDPFSSHSSKVYKFQPFGSLNFIIPVTSDFNIVIGLLLK